MKISIELRDVSVTAEEALEGLKERLRSTRSRILSAPKKISLSKWCDENRHIGLGAAESGPWRTDRAPYQREILDIAGRYETSRMVLMASAQVGKTSIMENVIAYYMVNDPAPIMLVMPNKEMGVGFVEGKLEPMIEASPILHNLLAGKNKRDGGNRKLEKKYTGGFLTVVSAKAPSSLRSRSIRILLLDEIDAYDEEVGSDGDPIKVAEVRTTTFPNRKVILASTPTVKGFSRIEKEFERSDKRYFHVPCPLCGHFQVLKWGGLNSTHGIKWEGNDSVTVQYRCELCQGQFGEAHKMQMMMKGEWRKTNPEGQYPGFHINSLYSPWVKWAELVDEWLEVHAIPDKQREFFNLRMGEAWEDNTSKLETSELALHMHDYNAPCPTRGDGCNGVGIITVGVDVQQSWIEAAVWGFGVGEEMWMLDHAQFHGETSEEGVWRELESFLREKYATKNGYEVAVSGVAIDSGDQTEMVYRMIKDLKEKGIKNVFPIKGYSGARSVFQWSRHQDKGKPRLGIVGVDQAKGILLSRLKNVGVHGAGFIHLPPDTDSEVLEQLTSERRITIYSSKKAGQKLTTPKKIWQKMRDRNEQLDCMVYAYAALQSFSPQSLKAIGDLVDKHRDALGTLKSDDVEKASAQVVRPRKIELPNRTGGLLARNPWRL